MTTQPISSSLWTLGFIMPHQTEDFRKYTYMIFLKLDDTIFFKKKEKTRGLTIFKYTVEEVVSAA